MPAPPLQSAPGGEPNPLPPFLRARYEWSETLGNGAYGTVFKARQVSTGRSVAIKHLSNIFVDRIRARRALREIVLLTHLHGHDNIVRILDVELPPGRAWTDVFVVLELMETDLHAIIKSGQNLSDQHLQYFIYQTVRGLKYIHSAGIIHRDLKTGNLLVNSDCSVKICDFGLARQAKTSNSRFHMTEYVATRWFRAPEVMMTAGEYNEAMDLWSVGCILAEFLGGKPIFKGRTYLDTLNQIISVLGTPSDVTLRRVVSNPDAGNRILSYMRTLEWQPKTDLAARYPKANPLAVDLLEKLLRWDPSERLTVDGVLAHPWLAAYHELDDEPTCPQRVSLPFDDASYDNRSHFSEDEKDQLRRRIMEAGKTVSAGRVGISLTSLDAGSMGSLNGLRKHRSSAAISPTAITPVQGKFGEEPEPAMRSLTVEQELREAEARREGGYHQ
ncbi:CMGC/MAPK/ERK protein kinase [Hyaloraphidium curvatum]|nr:CMGC/MAPK/ERK protein kinase [Hyaloraphidium curvatum]